MNLNTPLVLVTGAAGWLGSRLVESLVRGLPGNDALKTPAPDLRIRCLLLPGQDAAPLRKLSNRIEIVTGDIRNAADCARLCTDAKGAILFHTAGITVGSFIRQRRLERCRADLSDPLRAGERITEIALRWGFNDMPHFSRVFRATFGATPSDFRAASARRSHS